VMIQFVPDNSKSRKEKGRGSLNVWIQQARGLKVPYDQGTYLKWLVVVMEDFMIVYVDIAPSKILSLCYINC